MKHYTKGDSIILNCHNGDATSRKCGEVVHVDNEHLIVRFEFTNAAEAKDFNRNSLTDEEIYRITGIETLRKNQFDILLDMKSPHTYLLNDALKNDNTTINAEDIFWDNLVLNEPINGFAIVEKNGQYNFVDPDTDEYISNLWFDKAINWTTRTESVRTFSKQDFGKPKHNAFSLHPFKERHNITLTYTIVLHEGICYELSLGEYSDGSYFITATPLKHQESEGNRRFAHRWPSDFDRVFGVKIRTFKDILDKTVCKIDNRWYLTSSIAIPWVRGMEQIYKRRDKDASIKMDKQWWYFLYTTMACAELCIGEFQGKYGLFPLVEDKGTQHAEYYVDEYPFIYDSVKVYDSHTVHHGKYSENAHGYIAVNENGKWGLFKITGLPTMKLERVAESIYSSPMDIFNALGIELPSNAEEADLREQE